MKRYELVVGTPPFENEDKTLLFQSIKEE